MVVEGDPQTIIRRGEEIEALGRMMSDSATILEGLAEGTDGLQGKAAAKLREGVGDVHGTLAEAGQLYTPTGPVVRRYGVALSEDQSAIAGHVALCEGLWETFRSLPGSVEPRGTGGWFEPEAGSEEAQQQADEDEAKRLAYEAWEDEARRFDADYDSWESAFEAAAADVGDAVAGKIEDSFWDDLDGFVAGALKVLQVVGLVLAVACIIIGGPILAAIAAVVAIATLALTTYAFFRGDATLGDMIFAIVGVIPFGSLGKGVGPFFSDMAGGIFSSAGRTAIASSGAHFAGGLTRGFSRGMADGMGLLGSLGRGGRGALQGLSQGGANVADGLARLFGYTGQTDAPGILGGVWGDGHVKNLFGVPDGAAEIFGDGALHNAIEGLDVRVPWAPHR
ncbi:hypothetical protein OVA14_02760 [Agrococcus sp. SL85]|uniref:hypothetical protein n=1 Tax=Agrococcus sp. SL85 TaxID=2995141 RepID=UPI00226CEAB8|nr:hypothetical protein [Agrococcus sp. SL85]WAC66716.1 hypothetical protein OVA14_02760 [Agrococcus sp. SL85]